jgi:hypothetical protein
MTPTPGPWKWFNYPDGRMLLTGEDGAVIHCPDAPMSCSPEDQALIAAAPDLLEAVRAGGRYSDALRRYQDNGVNGGVIPGTDELDALFMDWHDKGHAAIAKAEGNA